MHMHGYEFFLVAHGFANYKDGRIIGDNENISCANHTGCPFVDFNEDVLQRKSRERTSFIAKNSILVPPQGYAIVRFRYLSFVLSFLNFFRASNPGIWPIHCHQGSHLYGGMSAFIEIKDELLNRPYSYLPHDFPRCGDYKASQMPKIETDDPTGGGACLTVSVLILFVTQIFVLQ